MELLGNFFHFFFIYLFFFLRSHGLKALLASRADNKLSKHWYATRVAAIA